jgi:predicted membrane protein
MGTPFSAPGAMIGAQLAATAVLHGRPSRTAARTVGVLGSAMVVGYLGERVVQQRLVDWDAVETPIAMAGLGGAVVMAWLGLGAAAR